MAPDTAKSLTGLLRELREADRDFDVNRFNSLIACLEYFEKYGPQFPEPGTPSLTITCTDEGLFRVRYTFPSGKWYAIKFGAGEQP